MRILHQPVRAKGVDLAWTHHTAPARAGASLVLCASMLVRPDGEVPKRVETPRGAAHRIAPAKPAGDFLVQGHAVPPSHRSGNRTAVRVAIECDGRRKELAVFGDRRWRMGAFGLQATNPEPFQRLPITWERAFGGPGEPRNPVGSGNGPGERGRRLPNVEYLEQRVGGPLSRPEPAGFGPLDPQWQPRAGKLGTFDDAWLAWNWPLMPDDFDPTYWNEAPADQQFAGWFRGDELLAFENMHPDHPRLEMRLPGLRARAFIQRHDGAADEIPLRLDTIDVDVDNVQAELVWRGCLAVRSARCKELAFLFTLAEPLGTPITAPTWQAMFLAARKAAYPTAEEQAAKAEAARREREAGDAARQARLAPLHAQAASGEAQARAAAAARRMPAPPDPQAQRNAIIAAIVRAKEKHPEQAAELDSTQARLLAAQERVDRQRARWSRERLIAALQANEDLTAADLSNLDLSALDLTGARLTKAVFTKAQLARTILRDADLTACDFTECDATGADFSHATLNDARLPGATLTGADFTACQLNRTGFTKAKAATASFDRAAGESVRFDEATLAGASFRAARLPRARFVSARLDHAIFDEARLDKADFAKASGESVSFRAAHMVNVRAPEANLPGAVLTDAQAERSVWRLARLAGADFSRAHLGRAIFAEAALDRAVFDRALVVDGSFDDTTLHHAVLTHADLLRASFVRADLADANLQGANLYRAGFFGAHAPRARFEEAFLAGTLLAP